MKKKGMKNEGKLHYVIENTCRKNARFPSLHDVDENKGSYWRAVASCWRLEVVVSGERAGLRGTVARDKKESRKSEVRGAGRADDLLLA